ncbi:hypothetical protein EWU23_08810 [Cytophagaceae bacterium 50C-KIRBA]|uniref:Uncharacterized protein n=1 Tax=Aquirufa beregesia TaxID=2516556 RepID=A0ABX0EVI0_9BACT|nr:hypothetical protein [Aquirufa beregesia]
MIFNKTMNTLAKIYQGLHGL